MKFAVTLACAFALSGQTEPKNFQITSPTGSAVRMVATEILREPSVIHLKGGVEVRIRARESGREYTAIRADEADYHIDTGAVEPRGHVVVRQVLDDFSR